ncbi:MAG: cytochrome c3 family protein [Planctomycetes bacterium]|nr:cytochrome c3 family protein [Planctomycetota bacterium]
MSEHRTPTILKGSHGVIASLRSHWLTALVVVVALALFVGWFRGAFYDTGYAPEQYIKYSHKLHAGDLKIDCRYCHFNAERGKHAGVPPMSVCLGCHGPQNGAVRNDSPEIQKLLKVAEDGKYTDEHGVVHEGGVVHWNRVHRLPDFVYFSHQWHVAANVACQTCHGPIEDMAVVRQFSPLTMGWCIECHRKTNYVGGPHYDPKDPSTFAVGTANYDVQRMRVKPDAVAEFVQRETKGVDDKAHAPATHDAGHAHEHVAGAPAVTASAGPAPFGEQAEDSAQRREELAGLLKQYPKLKDLPNWRIADLPETHREVYGKLIDAEQDKLGRTLTDEEQLAWFRHYSFQNSPTQCSTCHQ